MTPSNDRMGEARLSLPDGREVALCFTWARIDTVGRQWVVDSLTSMMKGEAGCQAAMAELLVLASGGEITAADLFSSEKPVVGFEQAFKALEDAWLLARFGPTRRPAEDGNENPRKSRRIWWKPFSLRRSKQA